MTPTLPFPVDTALPAGARIAITANRNLTSEDEETIARTMRDLCATKPAELIFGGARGGDTVALRAAKRYREAGTRLVVIVAGTVAQQPRLAAQAIRECADEVVELGLPITAASLKLRNAAMVDRGTEAVAFWNGVKPHSGTWSCVAYSSRVGKNARIVPIIGGDS